MGHGPICGSAVIFKPWICFCSIDSRHSPGLVIGFIWLALSLATLWPFGSLTPQAAGQLNPYGLAIAALAMILNTVIQEVLARGYILQTIQSQTHSNWAVLVTSLLFVLYHALLFKAVGFPP